jgi:hypothetical protein
LSSQVFSIAYFNSFLKGRWNDWGCESNIKRKYGLCQKPINDNKCEELYEENQLLKQKLEKIENKIRKFQACASDLLTGN